MRAVVLTVYDLNIIKRVAECAYKSYYKYYSDKTSAAEMSASQSLIPLSVQHAYGLVQSVLYWP